MLAKLFSNLAWLAQEQAADPALTAQTIQPLGWAFLVVSISFVVILVLWCYTKILSAPTDPAEVAEGD